MHIRDDMKLYLVREADVALVFTLWDPEYRGMYFKRLDRVREFLCLIHELDLVACDGIAVPGKVYERVKESSEGYEFPG